MVRAERLLQLFARRFEGRPCRDPVSCGELDFAECQPSVPDQIARRALWDEGLRERYGLPYRGLRLGRMTQRPFGPAQRDQREDVEMKLDRDGVESRDGVAESGSRLRRVAPGQGEESPRVLVVRLATGAERRRVAKGAIRFRELGQGPGRLTAFRVQIGHLQARVQLGLAV